MNLSTKIQNMYLQQVIKQIMFHFFKTVHIIFMILPSNNSEENYFNNFGNIGQNFLY